MNELTRLTALQLGAAIRTGQVSVAEAVRAALDVIAARDGELNSFITVTGQEALDRARRLQPQVKGAQSPLFGVPMALKDNICTQGIPTTCASRLLADFKPPYQATAAELLDGAGAVLLGKTNMDEFAMGSTSETSWFGPVKNPWDLTRSPGGSSGGSAAAVAAGAAWFSLGSDTGGSIRQPAAHCGLTGMRPTYGAVSRYGLVAHASSLDQLGPLCRDAADCAAVLDVIHAHDRRDSTSLPTERRPLLPSLTGDVRGLRLGIPADFFGAGLDGEVRRAVLSVADVLRSRGAAVEKFALSILPYGMPAYRILSGVEASSSLSRYDGIRYGRRGEGWDDLDGLYRKTRTQGFGDEVKRRILLGALALSAGHDDTDYKKALRARELIRQAFAAAFDRFHLLLTPVAPTAAPKLGESLGDPPQMNLSDIYTVPASLAGLPALSVPCGLSSGGLPIGAQLIAPPLGEHVALNAAHALQQETDYHRALPVKGGG